MADSFKVVFKEGKNPYGKDNIYYAKNTACFASMNGFVSYSKNDYLEMIVIIEKEKVKDFSEEYITTFLDNIKLIGTIGYRYEVIDGDYFIHLNTDEIRIQNHTKFVTTALRCLYEPRVSDSFSIIGKHFVNLCNFFPEEDRGVLFCIASNIYCYHDGFNAQKATKTGYHTFNSNHLHISGSSCQILTANEIKESLDKSQNNMHSLFRVYKIPLDEKYKQDLKEETKEGYSVFL